MPVPPLTGSVVHTAQDPPVLREAARLLLLLGASSSSRSGHLDPPGSVSLDGTQVTAEHMGADEVGDWADSGAMFLTGRADGPPLVAPGSPATTARGAALAILAITEAHPAMREVDVDGALLLAERAALAGLSRNGAVSAGGSCRLVAASDGLLALNLPRPSDLDLVSAWLEVDARSDPWAAVIEVAPERAAVQLVERGQLIGLPVALVPQPGEVAGDEQGTQRASPARSGDGTELILSPWQLIDETTATDHTRIPRPPALEADGPGLVVDLSSMWAGPLCANLLGLAGFRVIKVESASRPDGARKGPSEFFDLLHHGHESVVVDFDDPSALDRLGWLLASADVVIESSRPRALDQLGVGPAVTLARSPSAVWVSITGYGRWGPWSNRVAFGDDAAAAGGMVVADDPGAPMFCGDALGDPLAGLHAALVALAMSYGGHGGLVDVAMRDVVASALTGVPVRPEVSPAALPGARGWQIGTPGGFVQVREPTSRPVPAKAVEAGVDTDRVFAHTPGFC